MSESLLEALGRLYTTGVVTIISLNGKDPYEIITRYQQLFDEGQLTDIFTGRPSTLDEAASELFNALKKEAITLWYSSMTREQALAIRDTVAALPYGKIILCQNVEICGSNVPQDWSEVHPEETPIFLDCDCM